MHHVTLFKLRSTLSFFKISNDEFVILAKKNTVAMATKFRKYDKFAYFIYLET